MRIVMTFVVACALTACGTDDKKNAAGSGHAASGRSGSGAAGPASKDAGALGASSVLERPGLPRPPVSGLPADLRPPR